MVAGSALAAPPPYFLALKLEAWIDRGEDTSSRDLEDIVTLAIEVPNLVDEVLAAGMGPRVRDLWQRAFSKFFVRPGDLGDLVDMHIGTETEHRDRVVAQIVALAAEAAR